MPIAVVQVWFADMLTNGMAGLAVCLMVCLLWMACREKLKARKDQKKRRQQGQNGWGYEQ